MKDRGMLKWAPFRSLEQQDDFMAQMEYERNKKPCPQMSEEKAAEINDLLVHYHGEKVFARFWQDGYIYSIHGRIHEINRDYRFLLIEGAEIPFHVLTELVDEE